jgi:hypothetical protein
MQIYDRLRQGATWTVNFSQIYYMNLPRISVLACYSGKEFNFDFMEHFVCLNKVGFQLGKLMLSMKNILEDLNIQAIQLPERFGDLEVGQTISFDMKFRTKNVPNIATVCSRKYTLESDLNKTPQLYYANNGVKFILTLDPRWLATTTSFVQFGSGWVDVAGIAIVKQVSTKQVVASPYVIGIPKSPLDVLFSSNLPRSINTLC